jgi:two-component system phosphate regulon sensor histidine kinase PhoR
VIATNMLTLNRETVRGALTVPTVKRALLNPDTGALAAGALAATFLWRLVRQNAVVHRLRRQNQRVAELEQIKSTYLRLASHELRTPIGVARGYVDLARSGELGLLPDRFREALSHMEDSLRDVDAILAEMVEIARMQEGRRLLNVETLDLREPVREAVHRVRPLAAQRHQLVVDLPPSPVLIEGDRARVRMAVRNLLDNAVKYSPEGGEVRCTICELGGRASVTVSDQGIGIPQSHLKRLFLRFERASQTDSTAIPGTGLGLHLAREIARAHDGELRVSSQPGQGTTFVLVLPQAERRA